jgi:hypothetical protein
MNTHRAWVGLSTPVNCYVRKDDARPVLGALSVALYPYGSTVAAATPAATSPATGQAQFTVGTSTTRGMYRFTVTSDGALVYDGILEVV